VAKRSVEADRRARVEEMRRAQQAKERRRSTLIIGSAVLVMVVLVGLVTFVVRDYLRDNPNSLDAVGVAASAASCDEPTEDPATGVSVHVGPGTETPDTTRVEYDSVPPSHGEHFAAPAFPAQPFYTAEDRPAMEELVHNLEHGYTVLWYAEDLPQAQVDELETIAGIARGEDATAGKFVVSAWDASYGDLPGDKPVALSHWGAENGHRQLCGSVSGEAVQEFISEFPAADSPEPNGQ
jgi:hypothetical protein